VEWPESESTGNQALNKPLHKSESAGDESEIQEDE